MRNSEKDIRYVYSSGDIHYVATLQELLYVGSQCWFRDGTNNCLLLLTSFEDHDSWDTSYSIIRCNFGALISVDLEDFQPSGIKLW